MNKPKITIYIDASYRAGRCGYSFIYKFSNKKFYPAVVYGTSSVGSSTAAGLMAIIKAFQYFKQVGIKDHPLEVRSDYDTAVTYLKNKDYYEWKLANWKRPSGKPIVKDIAEWVTLSSLLEEYNDSLVTFTKAKDKLYNHTAHIYGRVSFRLLPCDEPYFFTAEISKNPYFFKPNISVSRITILGEI